MLFIGLPGHPVSSYLVLRHIILDSYIKSLGSSDKFTYGLLEHNISNNQGREVLNLCKLLYENGKCIVSPLYYSSSNIGILTKADGYFVVGENTEGLKEKERVKVYLF